MFPVVVAAMPAFNRGRRLRRIAVQPFGDVVIEILLAPDHAGESLSLHETNVVIGKIGLELCVERVRFRAPGFDYFIEGFERVAFGRFPQAGAELKAASRRNAANETGGGLGSHACGIRRRGISVHHIFVKCIFKITSKLLSEKSPRVGFIFGKKPFVGFLDKELKSTQLVMDHVDRLRIARGDAGPLRIDLPRPRIAKPYLWQKVQRGLLWSAVPDGYKNVDRCRIDPRVLDENVKIAVLVEDPGIDKLVFPLQPPLGAVGLHKIRIGKFRLRIFVEHFQVGVGGRRVQVVVELLAIFASALVRPKRRSLRIGSRPFQSASERQSR